MDNVGTLLRTIQYKGRTASLIIKVLQLNGVQKQVQFLFVFFQEESNVTTLATVLGLNELSSRFGK